MPPIKDIFGSVAPLDDYQFIADAARTVTVKAFNSKGQYVETLTLNLTTSALHAKQSFSGKLGNHSYWVVTAISGGTVYALPSKNEAITSTNGLSLTVNDVLGPNPGTGTIIQSISGGETVTVASVTGALPAGAAVIGQTPDKYRVVDVVLTATTTILTATEVVADSQVVTNCVAANDATGELVAAILLDEDDNTAVTCNLYLFNANVSLGPENELINIADADARNLLGVFTLSGGGALDLINSRAYIAVESGAGALPIPIVPGTGTRNIWVAMSTAATPTYASGLIPLRLIFRDGM